MAHQRTQTRLQLQARALRLEALQVKAPAAAYTLKGVQSAVGVAHWSTLKRWRALGFPVRRGPDRKTFVLLTEVRAWLLAFHALQQERTRARLAAYTSTFQPKTAKNPSLAGLFPAGQAGKGGAQSSPRPSVR